MKNAFKLTEHPEYNDIKDNFSEQDIKDFEERCTKELPEDLDEAVRLIWNTLEALEKERTKTVLDYLKRTVKQNWFGEIVVPPVIAVSEALGLSLKVVEEIYQELLERCIIRQQSDYEFTLGNYFPLTEEIKRRVGTISSRR